VIVSTSDLESLRGEVAMVDGGFDPLHAGHIAYLREAADLGAPVLCNVAPDEWIRRKHPPLLPQQQRVEIVDAIRYVSYTHPARGTTASVLRVLRPRYYVKGLDWQGRLPEEEVAICAKDGVEIVYLDTVVGSSTGYLARYLQEHERRHGHPSK
jgi:D-beta-D-heptose 7-phosphate kinase/D-beta-D-heptose 1-phosphate adenosyltransferase